MRKEPRREPTPETAWLCGDRAAAAAARRGRLCPLLGVALTIKPDDLVHERDLRPDAPLDDLLASIPLSGLEVPLLVRLRVDGKYIILDGNRRVKTCRQLGRTEIPCQVFEAEDKAKEEHLAELAAFHLNTARRDLAPSVLALELARYKAAYEALYPETAQGKAPKGRKGRPGGELSQPEPERYTKAAEKIIGMKERTIQRFVAIGANATPEILHALDLKAITAKDAEALAQLGRREQRAELTRFTEEREQRKAERRAGPRREARGRRPARKQLPARTIP